MPAIVRTHFLTLIFLGVCVVVAARPARAGDIPASARSRSLGMPPILVRDVVLGYEPPQVATGLAAQGFATALGSNTTNNARGLGVLFRANAGSFLLLSQPVSDVALGSVPGRSFQLGWARRVGAARVGLALRGGYFEGVDRFEDGTPGTTTVDEAKAHVVEGALGIGAGENDRFWDVTLSLRDFQSVTAMRRVEADTMQLSVDEEIGLDRPSFGATFRAGAVLVDRVELLAVGSWTEDDADLDVSGSVTGFPVVRIQRPLLSRRWQGGLALSGDLHQVDRLTAYAHHRRDDTSDSRVGPTFLAVNTTTLERSTVGMSIERELPRHFAVLAGWRLEWTQTRSREEREGLGGSRFSFDRESDALVDAFSWGLRYAWKRLVLVGATDTRLQLDRLILSLDAHFRF